MLGNRRNPTESSPPHTTRDTSFRDDRKEDYKCVLGVIEIELETLKKYQGRLSEHGLQGLYHRIKSKSENNYIQI